MKSKLYNNFILKIISVILAIIIWIVVINISNPEETIKRVLPLNVYEEEVILNSGKVYKIKDGNTVTITYKIRSKDKNKIKAEDFKAGINLLELYSITGAVPVQVEVLSNSSLIIGEITTNPSVVNVITEDIQRKEFVIGTRTKGSPAGGYSVGTISLFPEKVYLNGPVSAIGLISSVGIEIDVEAANNSFSGVEKPVFYDANGNKINIDLKDVYFDNDKIYYDIELLKGKSLELKFNVGGEVANGYRFVGAESTTKAVSVIGLPEDLSEIDVIEIPPSVLNLDNATVDKNISLDVSEYLPNNVSISGNSIISVILKVEALNKKSIIIDLKDIEEIGKNTLYNYKIVPEKVTIIVAGLEDELETLSVFDLSPRIDYSDMEKGKSVGVLEFELKEGLTIDSYTPFEILIYEEGENIS